YGLTLHPEKTRLVDFRRPTDGGDGPDSFDALGFTHYWGRSRKGNWVVQRKTASRRFGRALKRVVEWCRHNRHRPLREQHKMLAAKVRGHYNYFGITGNGRALTRFFFEVIRGWRRWLDRRSSKARMNWTRFTPILANYPLPPPRVVHSIYRRAANPTI